MKEKKVLSRDEFRKAFIEPLENKFKFKVYWNSKELIHIGLKPTEKRGASYCYTEGYPIVMRYTKNNLDMLNTLIHEYGHSYLHNKSEEFGDSLSRHMQEYEAESVAKEVFNLLDLEYSEEKYISKHYNKCSSYEIFKCNQAKRYDLIKSLAKEIADLLFPKLNLIKELNAHSNKAKEPFKYQVYCKSCNKIISKYKRKSKIIKCNAKGYYCISCGKDKSINQLIVSEIYS